MSLPKLTETQVKKLKASIQEKLRKKKAERGAGIKPTPAPRYDDVFERGSRWLEELAGAPLSPVSGSDLAKPANSVRMNRLEAHRPACTTLPSR